MTKEETAAFWQNRAREEFLVAKALLEKEGGEFYAQVLFHCHFALELAMKGKYIEEFSIQGLYPPLSSAGQLWTYNDVNNLYILDSNEKRLLIINKDGRLLSQVENTDWANPQGLVVEEANKRAFIADDGKLYQVSLP